MPADLDNISVLPKMRSEKESRNTFQLVWNLDLQVSSSSCLIKLLFKNIDTGYFIIDSIPPELLSYCTIGSHFKNGKLIKARPIGTIHEFTINSTEANTIVDTKDALADAEYGLSLRSKYVSSEFKDKLSSICKSQKCLVYHYNNTNIVIPCSVLAGAYYFKSTSLREAVFSRKLEILKENIKFDSVSRYAKITLKPGAADSDAKVIARFLSNEFAKNRFNMISNHLYATRGMPQQIKADFPVAQELTIKARGQLSTNPAGGQTFVVFQLLREDSHFPFDTLDIERRKYESEGANGEPTSFPALSTTSGENMTTSNPASDYIRRTLNNHVTIENPNQDSIRENKLYISTSRAEEEKAVLPIPSSDDVQLSTQPEISSDGQSVARSNVETVDDQSNWSAGYEMTLDEFKQMVEKLERNRVVDGSFYSNTVTNFTISRQHVWQRKRSGKMRASLRETYKGTSNKRECLYVSFCYEGKHIYLVEIDQSGLPGGCSTYVLISQKPIEKKIANNVVRDYVEGKKLKDLQEELASLGIIFESKHHPRSISDDHLNAWRMRLLEIIRG